jgi:hypothetical protein
MSVTSLDGSLPTEIPILRKKDRRKKPVTSRKEMRYFLREVTKSLSACRRYPLPRIPIFGWRQEEKEDHGVLLPEPSLLPPEGNPERDKSPPTPGNGSRKSPSGDNKDHHVPEAIGPRSCTCLSARRDHETLSERFRVPLEPRRKACLSRPSGLSDRRSPVVPCGSSRNHADPADWAEGGNVSAFPPRSVCDPWQRKGDLDIPLSGKIYPDRK